MRTRSVLSCLLVLMLATGCADAIDGTARPAPNLIRRPVTGETVKQVLLDDAELTRILSQPFKTDSHLPPRFGGPDKLQRGFGFVSPPDCTGITLLLAKSAYESADVRDVARESWWNAGGPASVISVSEGVVTLPTGPDAEVLFDKFSRQWDQCNGTTVTIQGGGGLSFTDKVSEVGVADSVLAATVSVEMSGAPGAPRPEARAIGVRRNCLVEVEVDFFSDGSPSSPGPGGFNARAIDIAHVMMDRISALN
jgi:PknH-like extracellular domain